MVPMMILKRPMRLPLAALLLAGIAIATPVSLRLDPETGLHLVPALAHAKGGDRDGDDHGGRGGDDRGGRDDDRGGDDRGGRDRGGHGRGGDDGGGDDGGADDSGADDSGADDQGGHGRGRDDRGTDDHGGRARGRDDRPSGTSGGGQAGSRPTEIERSSRGIEVTYADGWREELESGRYELKDAQGRTVVERTATDQDVARLSSFSR